MTDLSTLQPSRVWDWFAKICAIPHPTFNERKLGEYILSEVARQGSAYGLTGEMDAQGNIRIQKPASADMAHAAPVAIQAHYDMVAQKAATSNHDFVNDPIETIIKDGWVWANDTTLGADNGIGLAMALAVAFSDDISHPPLTLIITSEEEVGMGGVQALNPDWFDMDYLINLDSEDEGALFVGCAGGRDATFSRRFDLLAIDDLKNDPLEWVTLSVSGLHGGHSGIDINKGFANANLVLARVLSAVYATSPFYLGSLNGGVLRNVITRDAQAVILGDKQAIAAIVAVQSAIIANELAEVEPLLNIELSQVEQAPTSVIGLNDTQKALDIIRTIPNGVLRMSNSFAGVVESSISMGVVQLQDGELSIQCLMRSLSETPKDDISDRLNALARLTGITLELSDDYPGWQPAASSYLLNQAKPIIEQIFGKAATIEVIHAGLECGILNGKASHLDMISFGPNIRAAHSPKERVEIASVEKNWEVLLALLTKLPAKN